MSKGLGERRIAVVALETEVDVSQMTGALRSAGATVDVLSTDSPDDAWQGARYAGLVILGADSETAPRIPRLEQLAREFLVTDKPLAALGSARLVVLEAGGAAGRRIAAGAGRLREQIAAAGGEPVREPTYADQALLTADGSVGPADFAGEVLARFAESLEEQALDEMSELSFPASDPPAVSPGSSAARPEDGGRT